MILWVYLLALASAHVHMNFTIFRGNSPHDMAIDRTVRVHRRDDEIEIDNYLTFYLAEVEIGSNKQKVGVLLDTGSSDLWVSVSLCGGSAKRNLEKRKYDFRKFLDAPLLEEVSKVQYDCNSFGNFDPDKLSSFTENLTAPAFEISYLDGSYADGYWGSDQVSWGEYSVNLTFGVAETLDSQSVFGIGFPDLEALNSYESSDPYKELWTYSNFPMKLKEDGLVNSWAYSLSLGRNNVSEGEILFGAIDHGKYDGQLQKVKMVNEYASVGMEQFDLSIILDGIAGDGFEHREQTVVVLDSGLTLLRLPESFLRDLVRKYSLTLYSSTLTTYEIDCDYLTLSETISFYLSGIEIQVPLRDLVFESYVCYFGIRPAEESFILGDNFLKNAYTVFDLENQEIALAQAAAEPKAETIEDISSTIPLALEAPYYTYTDLEVYYTTDGGYYTTTTRDAQVPLYDFQTTGRSSYDLGNTTYQRYDDYSEPIYGDTYSYGGYTYSFTGASVGCYGCPTGSESSTATQGGGSSTKGGDGSRALALGSMMYHLLVLGVMWL